MVYPTYNAKNHSLYITYYNQNSWGEIPLGTSSVSPDESLNEFKLYNNFPNPFNPSTKISWQSPVGCWQTLKIYDSLGNEVVTLVDEYKPAGSFAVNFDTANNGLASGVYFYRLQAGDFAQTKKMTILK